MPHVEGFDADFGVGVKRANDSPFDGPQKKNDLFCMQIVRYGTKL